MANISSEVVFTYSLKMQCLIQKKDVNENMFLNASLSQMLQKLLFVVRDDLKIHWLLFYLPRTRKIERSDSYT